MLPTSQGCLAYHSLAVFSVQRAGWAMAAPVSVRTIRNDFISHDDNVRRGIPHELGALYLQSGISVDRSGLPSRRSFRITSCSANGTTHHTARMLSVSAVR